MYQAPLPIVLPPLNVHLNPRIRYLPVAVLAVALARKKIDFGSLIRAAGHRVIALLRRLKRRFFLRSQLLPDTHELKTLQQIDADPSPMLDAEIRFGSSLTTA